MTLLIWTGAALTVLGLLAIVYCMVVAISAKRANLDDATMRARLQPLVPINLAAVLASIAGLLCVVVGVLFSG